MVLSSWLTAKCFNNFSSYFDDKCITECSAAWKITNSGIHFSEEAGNIKNMQSGAFEMQ